MKKYENTITQLLVLLLCLFSFPVLGQITLTPEAESCDGKKDGKITVMVGQPGNYEYSKDGSSFQASDMFENLEAGNYTITVKDVDTECEFSEMTTVDAGGSLSVSVSGSGVFTFCQQDGPPTVTLLASASGGMGPYTYSWPGGTKQVSSTGIYTVTATDANGCTENASAYLLFIPIRCSRDPNDMIGPEGYGDPKWVSVNDVLPYTIQFENDPEFATAPAQKVVIEHILDTDLNLYAVRLADFGFANQLFQVPANSTFYSQRLDLVDSLNIYVDVTAGIDVTENKVFWIFESIDPLTGLEPSDPLAGLLPVNDSITRAGEGFVNFTVKPKLSSMTGDTVHAVAAIIFDENETILTPEIFNVIDAFPPSTELDTLPVNSPNPVALSWSAQDDTGGCGVAFYDLYVSTDGGSFALHTAAITETTFNFTGNNNATYEFYVVATDNVGNAEDRPSSGEATTVRDRTEFDLQVLLEGPYAGNGTMDVGLNTYNVLPLTQPYNTAPWNYTGTEELASLDADMVDWVLVTLRRDLDNATTVDTLAAMLRSDGQVLGEDGNGILSFDFTASPNDSFYVAIYHRNHVGLMTANKIAAGDDDVFRFDFRTNMTAIYGAPLGLRDLGDGQLSMLGGDYNANGQIQNTDFNAILIALGLAGYHPGDINLNSQVQNTDVQNFLLPNIGRGAAFDY